MGPLPAGINELESLYKYFIQIIVGLSFVALVVVLVWAGIRFLTSGGEAKAIQAAGQTITWALLGILFLIIAWLILLLIKAFTGVDVTIFNVKVLM